jgi:small basic protein (TIGR04137 family)
MSLHSSLKTKSGALNQHRNVLTRAERVESLTSKDAFDPKKDTPLGLVKVSSRKTVVKKKPSKAAEAAATAEDGKS